ncbi:MAG TPA: DMT family transporter [Devosiaceae bacterium]|jgi:drug/metabolite transporter (DMT)-like permease|nr:DMT family transporter [Devosiaceae bacterium]
MNLLVMLAMVAFAANSVLARLALGTAEIDAGGYTAIRLLAGAATLALILMTRRHRFQLGQAAGSRARWTTAAALFAYAIAFSYAYELLGAGMGALILFATVQASMLGWALIKGDRPSPLALLGMVVALGAFVYLVSPGLVAPHPLGTALMVVSGLSWAVYSLLGRGSREPLVDTSYNFMLTVPVALLLALVSLAQSAWSPAGVGWAVASGALASGLGYAVWYSVLPRLSRSAAAIVQLTVPVIAAAGGILFIGESPSWRLAIASVLILGGVAVAITARRRAPA